MKHLGKWKVQELHGEVLNKYFLKYGFGYIEVKLGDDINSMKPVCFDKSADAENYKKEYSLNEVEVKRVKLYEYTEDGVYLLKKNKKK